MVSAKRDHETDYRDQKPYRVADHLSPTLGMGQYKYCEDWYFPRQILLAPEPHGDSGVLGTMAKYRSFDFHEDVDDHLRVPERTLWAQHPEVEARRMV
jgi:hypothetical protein